MSDELPVEETDLGVTLDDEIDNAINEEVTEDSTPQEEDAPEAETPKQQAEEESQEIDGTQKRINKVIAQRRKEKERADALQEKLDKLEASQSSKPIIEPRLEDFDFDDQAYNSALIEFKVDQKLKLNNESSQKALKQQDSDQRKTELMEKFNGQSEIFAKDKPDFNDVLNQVPTLQPSVLEEVMGRDNGPELAYFLGTHLDIADKVANMNPVAAGIKIGEISRKLAEPKQIKPSGASDPIDPLKSSGVTSKERGPAGATFE